MVTWLDGLEELLFQKSRTMDPPWGPVLRRLRYPVALIRDWLEGEINIRAMSLAYTTLLSLVPLMVFSLSILKGLGARGDLRILLHEFFRPMGSAAYAADRDRAAIRHEHARRIARLPRPGVSRVHRGHDDSKDRDEFQLRLAGRAAAKLSRAASSSI